MDKQPIEALFRAMYLKTHNFADFVRSPVESGFTRLQFRTQGKIREVLSPNETLRAHHEFLRLFLLDFLPVNEAVVFSYRKGFNAYDAVSRHAAQKHFFVCDIENFFPSLKRTRIRKTIIGGRAACPISDLDEWLEHILNLVCVDDALPMGFSTSPSISNAALFPFDNALGSYALANDLVYTRYSDDIIISAIDLSQLDGIAQKVATFLHDSMADELKLHGGKSKLLYRGGKVKLLGMVLLPNGTISVDASLKSEIEVLIHFYIRDRAKFVDRADGDPQKAEARLAGLLNYVNTIDKEYLQKLRRKFGATVVDLFLHRSFG